MTTPVVLDLDRSVGALPRELRLPLAEHQEALRFGCSLRTLARFAQLLDERLPAAHGTVLFGSGDFHHLSWPLIARVRGAARFQVVVLDNHPDNMRYPFGVHCGSWVRRVARLPQVSHVHVVGITSTDIDARHAWENYRAPLRAGRLSYWSIGVETRWAARAGIGDALHGFAHADALVEAFVAHLRATPQPAYLSIDKDVFDDAVAHTNWDQGRLYPHHATAIVAALTAGLVGSDITGEVSMYRYRSRYKRWLAARDAQPPVDPDRLAHWQTQQHALNAVLLAALDRCRA